MVAMGRVVAPYGIYGWLKVQPDTATVKSLLDYADWWLGGSGQWRQWNVEHARVHGNTVLVKLRGVDDRDAAFAFKGQLVAVPRAQLPPAAEDEYYWTDLIGLGVRNQQQVDLGRVADVFATGANDVLVVRDDAARERLLPFVAQVVLKVDLAAGSMLVDWDETF